MTLKKHTKTFDAVQTMRDIRDRLSERFNHLSFAEQKRYMRERLGPKAPGAQREVTPHTETV